MSTPPPFGGPLRPLVRLVRLQIPGRYGEEATVEMSAIGMGHSTRVVRKQWLDVHLDPTGEKADAAALAQRAVRDNYNFIIL